MPKGGPDGGDGGPGGDVVLVADPDLRDLSAFRPNQHVKAGRGEGIVQSISAMRQRGIPSESCLQVFFWRTLPAQQSALRARVVEHLKKARADDV